VSYGDKISISSSCKDRVVCLIFLCWIFTLL